MRREPASCSMARSSPSIGSRGARTGAVFTRYSCERRTRKALQYFSCSSRSADEMKLGEALKAVAAARSLPVARDGFLVCGFEPLHLPVFLQASFQRREPGHSLRVSHG